MANAVIRIFPATPMYYSHRGLKEIAKESRVNLETLESGEFVLFLNKAQTAFKLFAANNTIVYYRHARGSINMEAVRYIPSVFGGGEFKYDRALEKVLDKKLKN